MITSMRVLVDADQCARSHSVKDAVAFADGLIELLNGSVKESVLESVDRWRGRRTSSQEVLAISCV